jgi:hypothetical protein
MRLAFPLLAPNGLADGAVQCPLLGVKRTWRPVPLMSANDPSET